MHFPLLAGALFFPYSRQMLGNFKLIWLSSRQKMRMLKKKNAAKKL